jgi:DNA-directed RNA polymerase subunit beta'
MELKRVFFNNCFDKNKLKELIGWYLACFGHYKTTKMLERLKQTGYYYSTRAGISLGLDDLKIPPTKRSSMASSNAEVEKTSLNWQKGNCTTVQQLQSILDLWHRTSEDLKQQVIQNFKSTDILNPVYMMAFSGARGNISQVRQLVGMRGLMADPQGQIIEYPIRSNFKEGLSVTEYVISCYGARKGVVDTALRTATSGYLTRRLVDVCQDFIIFFFDCKTKKGVNLINLKEGSKIIYCLEQRLLGRILAENITSKLKRNQQVYPLLAKKKFLNYAIT